MGFLQKNNGTYRLNIRRSIMLRTGWKDKEKLFIYLQGAIGEDYKTVTIPTIEKAEKFTEGDKERLTGKVISLQVNNGRYSVTIPKEIVKEKSWYKSLDIWAELSEHSNQKIILTPQTWPDPKIKYFREGVIR